MEIAREDYYIYFLSTVGITYNGPTGREEGENSEELMDTSDIEEDGDENMSENDSNDDEDKENYNDDDMEEDTDSDDETIIIDDEDDEEDRENNRPADSPMPVMMPYRHWQPGDYLKPSNRQF
ncbi:trigger factor-like [Spodoptera frugiperda]|uniref:Trigger factor-like n=1 Tax=Spodoptera frugiperda TaxID=7108 RepID=A0A9R0ETN3_SPOFR|nr:trigger factor-like [Spodoptera frugiperda]